MLKAVSTNRVKEIVCSLYNELRRIMKVKVCFDCNRFFKEDFLFCPYCGKKLDKNTLLENEPGEEVNIFKEGTTRKNATEIIKMAKTKRGGFYDALFPREKLFINDFVDIIISIKRSTRCY